MATSILKENWQYLAKLRTLIFLDKFEYLITIFFSPMYTAIDS